MRSVNHLEFNGTELQRTIIVLDEALLLLNVFSSTGVSLFRLLRRALRNRQVAPYIFLVLIDTASTLSNFVPSQSVDPSARDCGKLLFDPFFRLTTWDVMKPFTYLTALDFFQLGRPLWATYPDQVASKIQSFAKNKLFGGFNRFSDVSHKRYLHTAMSVIGSRIGGLVPLRFSLASELVAGYMATCLNVSPDRESITAAFPSEPALAAGAALAMDDSQVLVTFLACLRDAMQNGEVSAGYRGELVARLLLLLCYDYFCSDDDPLPRVPLVSFLEKFGAQITFEVDTSDLYVRFNHFIPLTQSVSLDHLSAAANRGAALHFKPGQPGGDGAVPIFNNENVVVGAMSYQAKNIGSSLHDSHWPQSASSMLHCSHIYANDDLTPSFVNNSVGLYLQMGAPRTLFFVTAGTELLSVTTRSATQNYNQHNALFGMKYPFLDDTVVVALKSLLLIRDQAGASSDSKWWSKIFPLDCLD